MVLTAAGVIATDFLTGVLGGLIACGVLGRWLDRQDERAQDLDAVA